MAMYKVSELVGALLDAAVARAEGRLCIVRHYPGDGSRPIFKAELVIEVAAGGTRTESYYPSSKWEIGGPIIEREGINPFSYVRDGIRYWAANMEGASPTGMHGCTSLLVAAMRAYVASKFGEHVELPDVPSTAPSTPIAAG